MTDPVGVSSQASERQDSVTSSGGAQAVGLRVYDNHLEGKDMLAPGHFDLKMIANPKQPVEAGYGVLLAILYGGKQMG
jgi:hypothetical protein